MSKQSQPHITPASEVFRRAVATYRTMVPEELLLQEVFGRTVHTVARDRHDALVAAYAQLANLPLEDAAKQVAQRAQLVRERRRAAVDKLLTMPDMSESGEAYDAAKSDPLVSEFATAADLTIGEALNELYARIRLARRRMQRAASQDCGPLPAPVRAMMRETLTQLAAETAIEPADPDID